MAKRQISLLITEKMHYKLSIIAKHECRTLSKQIRYLIRVAVDEFEKEHGIIKTKDELSNTTSENLSTN